MRSVEFHCKISSNGQRERERWREVVEEKVVKEKKVTGLSLGFGRDQEIPISAASDVSLNPHIMLSQGSLL